MSTQAVDHPNTVVFYVCIGAIVMQVETFRTVLSPGSGLELAVGGS